MARNTRSRWTAGGFILIVAPLIYLIAEAVAARAWSNPRYSYSFNYISDLGVPGRSEVQGRVMDSPLHAVMNFGFVTHGILFIVAALILWRLLASRAVRWSYLLLAFTHGVGIILVGLFHGSQQASADGTIVLHGAGALLAIGAGNALAIVIGSSLLRQQPHWQGDPGNTRGIGTALIVLGALGVIAFAILTAIAGSPVDGIFERASVYSILASEVLVGLAVLLRVRKQLPELPVNPQPSVSR